MRSLVVALVVTGLVAAVGWRWVRWFRWRRVRDVTPGWLNENACSRHGDDRQSK